MHATLAPTLARPGLLLLLVLGMTLVLASTRPARAQATNASLWQAKTFHSSSGLPLPYRELRPKAVDASERYPLVIVLHGSGERGTDNAAQLKNGVSELFLKNRDRFPAYVIAPQCPEGQAWVETDWSALSHKMADKPSAPLGAVLELVEASVRDLPIDPSRIYVVGISMGGFGTWELLARRPDLFAAGVPICGGADLATAPRVAAVAVWAFHGDQDDVVKVTRSRTMVDALKKQHAVVRYTEYAGVNHGSWVPALAEPDLATWIFSQRRAAP